MTESRSTSGIRFKVAVVVEQQVVGTDWGPRSQVIAAGQISPFENEEQVPEALKAFILREEAEDAAALDPVAELSFRLGEVYGLDDNGRLRRGRGRELMRQAAELEAAAQEQEDLEGSLQQSLDEQTAEILQASHDASISLQLAQAQVAARRQDELKDALAEPDERVDDDGSSGAAEQVSPSVQKTAAEFIAEERKNADHLTARQQKQKRKA